MTGLHMYSRKDVYIYSNDSAVATCGNTLVDLKVGQEWSDVFEAAIL